MVCHNALTLNCVAEFLVGLGEYAGPPSSKLHRSGRRRRRSNERWFFRQLINCTCLLLGPFSPLLTNSASLNPAASLHRSITVGDGLLDIAAQALVRDSDVLQPPATSSDVSSSAVCLNCFVLHSCHCAVVCHFALILTWVRCVSGDQDLAVALHVVATMHPENVR